MPLCVTICSSSVLKLAPIRMQAEKSATRQRKLLGNILMLSGIGMLAVFFIFKYWSAQQSSAGIIAFEQARSAASQTDLAPLDKPISVGDVEEAVILEELPGDVSPDTTSWSPQRVDDYYAAQAAESAAPQAILNIEHLNIRVPVFNGASDLNLNRGVARIIGTGRIGAQGNLGIAGHRDGFFRPLKDIQLGDRLTLETHFGTETFAVSSIEIVDPTELSVLAPTDTNSVTLVTCYPFYHIGNAPQRFIVKAEALVNQVNS